HLLLLDFFSAALSCMWCYSWCHSFLATAPPPPPPLFSPGAPGPPPAAGLAPSLPLGRQVIEKLAGSLRICRPWPFSRFLVTRKVERMTLGKSRTTAGEVRMFSSSSSTSRGVGLSRGTIVEK